MAKKVRKKLAEDETVKSWEFPTFDEGAFISHEFELTYAMATAGLLAVVIALVSWALGAEGLPVFVAPVVGIALIVFSPFLVGWIRPQSSSYTKTDWVGLIAIEAFGWLAIWFLLMNLVHGPI